jgi:glucosamine-6-phosphate deaminase
VPIRIVRVPDAAALGARGAELVIDAIADSAAPRVIAATGSTPMGLYAQLASRARAGTFDPSPLHVCQLDDYVAIARDDRRSLRGWLERSVVRPLEIPEQHVVWLDGGADDMLEECRRYDERLAPSGVDVAVLGLGPNGHLGFNEPPSGWDAPTRVVDLTPESIASNARYWGSEGAVPRRAVTAGMSVLMAARTIVLVVEGSSKRPILRRVLSGPVTEGVPASFLQRHPRAVVVADRAALGA